MRQDILSFLAVLWGVMIGCSPIHDSKVTFLQKQSLPLIEIQELRQEQNVGETVYLQGRVGRQVPLGNNFEVYQLEDATGSIWVLTNQPLLGSGGQIVIQGQVKYENMLLEGLEQSEFYIQELEQVNYQLNLPPSSYQK